MSRKQPPKRILPNAGFSLVETLVAITILLIVIVGPLSISSQSARSTSFASEQVIAFFLAQEAIEIIRKERDDLVLRSFDNDSLDAWATFTNPAGTYGPCFTANGCGVQISNDSIGEAQITASECPANGCPLYFDDSANSDLRSRYTFNQPGTFIETPYRRSVVFEELRPGEMEVIATVYWRNSDQREIQSVTVQSYLFDIYGN